MGSLILTDMLIQGANVGIRTSLSSDNATAFLIMNSLFTHVDTIVQDNSNGATLLAGGSAAIPVDSWGFGRVSNVNGSTTFFNGQNVPTMARPTSLIQDHSVGTPQNYFFTRRRPSYADIGHSELFDVKALGAKGDGSSDDTAVLNHILDVAVNISAVVYFPFGIYMVSSTVQIPVGSRIIGHAWPQIMGYGAYFADGNDPRAVVRVGSTGSRGSVEIQNMMFTVKGATAGAILVAWNVHETSQGSAGLWGTFPVFRLLKRVLEADRELMNLDRFPLPCWWRQGFRPGHDYMPKAKWNLQAGLYRRIPTDAHNSQGVCLCRECVAVDGRP